MLFFVEKVCIIHGYLRYVQYRLEIQVAKWNKRVFDTGWKSKLAIR